METCNHLQKCRPLFRIISSCLTTIGLSTWISLRLNVPSSRLGVFARTWRKLRMILITLIAPEVMLGFAARQYVVASWFAKTYDVSRTHGFFFAMGGFVTRDGHHPIVTKAQLRRYLKGIRDVKEEDIIDKSKDDSLITCAAIVQVVWFAAQEVARLHENLPISTLEIATMAFAAAQTASWMFWRRKPRDVSEAILLDPAGCQMKVFRRDLLSEMHHLKDGSCTASEEQTLADYPDSKTSRHHRTIGDRLNAVVLGDYRNFDPIACTSVPPFWSIPFGEGPEDLPLALAGQFICAIVFGVVHCLTWSTTFPSTIEMWIWRASALFIAGFPVICFVLLRVSNMFEHGSVPRGIFAYLNYGLVALYVVTRTALLILSFTTLRDLPRHPLFCLNRGQPGVRDTFMILSGRLNLRMFVTHQENDFLLGASGQSWYCWHTWHAWRPWLPAVANSAISPELLNRQFCVRCQNVRH
ncbi:hypothetical protein DFH08DRAFT_1021432, partial [Mycena albidolilacea]